MLNLEWRHHSGEIRLGRRSLLVAGLVAPLALIGTRSARAQPQSGNLVGTVQDTNGAGLSAVFLTLTGGPMPPITQFSGENGEFEFPLVPTGEYMLTAQRDGYTQIQGPEFVLINAGMPTNVTVMMVSEDEPSAMGDWMRLPAGS